MAVCSLRPIASGIAIAYLFVGTTQAQGPVPGTIDMRDIQKRFSSHITTIRGEQNPELIPFAEKMSATFYLFANQAKGSDPATFRQSIQETLGVTTATAIRLQKEFADDHSFRKSAEAVSIEGMRSLCDDVNAQGAAAITAAGIANRLEQTKRKRSELVEAHYRNIVDQLPGPDRQALVDFFARQVINGTYGWMDDSGLAADLPGLVEARMQDYCGSVDDQSPGKIVETPLGAYFSVTHPE